MIKKIFYPVLILTFIVFGCRKSSGDTIRKDEKQIKPIHTLNDGGNRAYDFSLKSVDGKTVKLSDFKGKIVIVDFWATWCGPCREGIPDLVDIQRKYKNKVVVIGISLDQANTRKNLDQFIKNHGINYQILYGNMDVVTNYGNIQAIPTTFIIDQNGNIVYKNIGLAPKSKYINTIESLLKKT